MDDNKMKQFELQKYYYSNELILEEEKHNPLLTLPIENLSVLEIGCGHLVSNILGLIDRPYKFTLIDKESIYIDSAQERIYNMNPEYLKKCEFYTLDILNEKIDYSLYDVIIISQLFHFFTSEQVAEICEAITERAKPNALIFVKVHSKKHYINVNKIDKSIFTTFFDMSMLKIYFPIELFEYISEKENIGEQSKIYNDYLRFAVPKILKNEDDKVEHAIQSHLIANAERSLEIMVKKKIF